MNEWINEWIMLEAEKANRKLFTSQSEKLINGNGKSQEGKERIFLLINCIQMEWFYGKIFLYVKS